MPRKSYCVILIFIIIIICAFIFYFPLPDVPARPQLSTAIPIAEPTAEPTATPTQSFGLGDRVTLARHFEHEFDITDWRHVIDKDVARGVSDSKDIVFEFEGDPVVLARLAVSLDGDATEGSQIIVGFLGQLLNTAEFNAAIKLLDKGGEIKFKTRRVLIYRDMPIRKAIIEIETIE